MNIELTQRAQIAFDHLPPQAQKQVSKLLMLLEEFPGAPGLRNKVRPLRSAGLPETYVAKAGLDYRVLFRHTESKIAVLEIAHHSRLESFFYSLKRGAE